ERGTFRPDLYYRLNVMSFHLPPLRKRAEDISPLVREMLDRFCGRLQRDVHGVSAEAMAHLEAFPWPGNIRQLENVAQHAWLVCTGPELRLDPLPEAVRAPADVAPINRASPVRPVPKESLHGYLNRVDRDVVRAALCQCGNQRARTARFLGISR